MLDHIDLPGDLCFYVGFKIISVCTGLRIVVGRMLNFSVVARAFRPFRVNIDNCSKLFLLLDP